MGAHLLFALRKTTISVISEAKNVLCEWGAKAKARPAMAGQAAARSGSPRTSAADDGGCVTGPWSGIARGVEAISAQDASVRYLTKHDQLDGLRHDGARNEFVPVNDSYIVTARLQRSTKRPGFSSATASDDM